MTESRNSVQQSSRQKSKERALAAVLITCIVIVGTWELLSNWTRRPFEPFLITGKDFVGFHPEGEGWSAKTLAIQDSRYEANILTYLLQRQEARQTATVVEPRPPTAWSAPVQIRLVHGYNMPDCMRMKHFEVKPIQDTRDGRMENWGGRRLQIWRVISALGEESIWVTSMLRAGDFSETDIDVCSMAYPRIGTPDDPGWVPRGVNREFLRHPVRDFRRLWRTKWNNAHCSWAVLLKLRQRPWASDELVTLVGSTEGTRVNREQEPAAIAEVVAAHGFVQRRLSEWREGSMEAGAGGSVKKAVKASGKGLPAGG